MTEPETTRPETTDPDPRGADPHRADPHRADPHGADARDADPHSADAENADTDPTLRRQLTVSERDPDALAADLAAWLRTRVEAEGMPVVTNASIPQNSGMSSTSVFFDATWQSGGIRDGGSFVARLAPDPRDFPVFHTYDLATQFHVMAGVAAATSVPVPPLCWLETDPGVLGTEFFVMRRVEGRVPTDNPPYVFLGWLFEATERDRAALADRTVETIAAIHAVPDPARRFPMLDGPGQALRRHVDWHREWYDWALAADGYRIPIIERAFDWLEEHWPTDPGQDVLLWGDARPGNIIFDGFEPAAVLDWEMAALGPREVDVAWAVFIHRFFQDIATRFDQPGLPDFLRLSQTVATYERASGHRLRDMDFHLVYAALRHAVVMARIKRRMLHFGEDTDTDDRDDYVMHRALLAAMLDGTCAWD
ncbi:MAG TPA: phosphotransferase family protein [Nocardia sp.]|uniref:phosphotransferase family protein n=1 Tax=Nocardia sp. TaxID=1821 RepID=UPI002B4B67C8|nr:phosphotransferase family protein [Nocardia sp.]HLS78171.1 phosphotransferase family protein [Nocardia sp.]